MSFEKIPASAFQRPDDQGKKESLPRGERIPAEKLRLEHFKYGKILYGNDPNARVHPSSEYALTAKSAKADPSGNDLPFKASGITDISNPNIVVQRFRKNGALFIRLDVDGDALGTRFRFRSESGEDAQGGRPYLESTSVKVPREIWRRQATQIAKMLSEVRVQAEPSSDAKEQRMAREPIAFDIPERIASAPDERVKKIMGAIIAGARLVRIPAEEFADESDFLNTAGIAVEALGRSNPQTLKNIRIVVGMRPLRESELQGEGKWIQYLSRPAA